MVTDANGTHHSTYECRCECGNVVTVRASALISGNTKSCGCLQRERAKVSKTTHGHRYSRLYPIWSNMLQRCYHTLCNNYANYGGRGIKVCDAWREDFEAFHQWAYENGYDEEAEYGECTLDRIDVNDDYKPENCRWVNKTVQANNTRSVHYITYQGETKVLSEWAQILGIQHHILYERIFVYKWSVDRAFTQKVRRSRKE